MGMMVKATSKEELFNTDTLGEAERKENSFI